MLAVFQKDIIRAAFTRKLDYRVFINNSQMPFFIMRIPTKPLSGLRSKGIHVSDRYLRIQKKRSRQMTGSSFVYIDYEYLL